MYKVIINTKCNDTYYNLTLAAEDDSHYINIYACIADNNVSVIISKSQDGFFFKSPCDEGLNIELKSDSNLEESFSIIKDHFLEKGYKYSTF